MNVDNLRFPKYRMEMIREVREEAGLVDEAKYLVNLNDGYEHEVYGSTFVVNTRRELKEELKSVVKVEHPSL